MVLEIITFLALAFVVLAKFAMAEIRQKKFPRTLKEVGISDDTLSKV